MRYRWRAPAALSVVVALLLSAGCSWFESEEKPKSATTTEIVPEGGRHTLENIVITAPKGTVTSATKLTVTGPVRKQDDASLPFGGLKAPNVQFDISLADGAQPLKPLDVEIPLTGNFLPSGAKPEHALLYSPNKAGEWRLVPGIVEKGVLHAKVASLSPKHIVFATPAALIKTVLDDLYTQSQRDAGGCKHEQTDAEGKVLLDGSGWEKNANSAVHPCLTQQNGKIKLKVTNNSALMWSIATSGPAVDASTDSTEIEMVRLIARSLPHDKKVKAFLAEGHDAWININDDALPVTVQMRADAVPFLANTIWIAVKFGVGVFSGKSGDGVLALANEVMKAPELLDCMADAFKSTANNQLDVVGIVRVALSECGQRIAKLVEAVLPPLNWWEKTVNTFFTVVDGIGDALGTINKAYSGVVQQIKGDVTITVKSAAPPKPPCATLASFKEAMRPLRATVTNVRDIKCSEGWAYGGINTAEEAGPYDATLNLVRYQNGRWVHIRTMNEPIFYGTPETDRLCGELPPDFRRELCMRI